MIAAASVLHAPDADRLKAQLAAREPGTESYPLRAAWSVRVWRWILRIRWRTDPKVYNVETRGLSRAKVNEAKLGRPVLRIRDGLHLPHVPRGNDESESD